MVFRRTLVTLILIAATPIFAGASALAHAKLVRSDPKANSSVAAPKIIKLTFSETIAPTFSGFTVAMSDGMAVGITAKVGDDGKTLTGTPTGPFMAGKYNVSWHATAVDDGHRTQGTYNFTVK
ncbi:MAG TPA: copper homeostasis periplasmic binding protein CopC [Rhizomicrobium sp.]|nr:copper homeostasis periplasmic binding protein CopC [Rhizomicrobium sp.]